MELEPPCRPSIDEGDVQVDDRNTSDKPIPQLEVPVEQVLLEPPVEPQLRRSTRKRCASQRYPPHEYVMINDSGEPENYQEQFHMSTRKSSGRPCKKK